jgi:N-acetylglucosaminyl-diphospho-decaprenol L-rhamnosyltransferase
MTSPTDTLPGITVSIVSHGHGEQVQRLVIEVLHLANVEKLILTLNISEALALPDDQRLLVLQNSAPIGFGANHNNAFRHCESELFCVLNPDVMLSPAALLELSRSFSDKQVGVAGPLVLASNGMQEDSWRKFPSICSLGLKAMGRDTTIIKHNQEETPFFVDWVAGMCMLFRAKSYRALNGFNSDYFMYYEDVDICARLWRKGLTVVANPKAKIIHDGQRASRRNFTHLRWHLTSMARYLLRYTFRMPRAGRIQNKTTHAGKSK